MSPRFTSAITRSPASRAYAHTSKNALTPSGPCASKKADCGFTATACSATASTMPSQKARMSPPREGGIRAGIGSRPTTSCVRLRSTRSANRSAKWVRAIAISPRIVSAVLDGGLQRAPGREFRHARRRDLHLLLGVPRVHAGTRRAHLGLELAEARERDVTARPKRVGHRFQESIDRPARVARGQLAASRDLCDELLLVHVPL